MARDDPSAARERADGILTRGRDQGLAVRANDMTLCASVCDVAQPDKKFSPVEANVSS